MAFFQFFEICCELYHKRFLVQRESLVHEERTSFLKSSSSNQDWLNFKGEGGSRNSRTSEERQKDGLICLPPLLYI
jgi:hypothetical protein